MACDWLSAVRKDSHRRVGGAKINDKRTGYNVGPLVIQLSLPDIKSDSDTVPSSTTFEDRK